MAVYDYSFARPDPATLDEGTMSGPGDASTSLALPEPSWRSEMPDRTCSIGGCLKTGRIVRGWCPMHYYRWKVNGDPLVVRRKRGSLDERLHTYFEPGDTTECWLWQGSRLRNGYGTISLGGKNYCAHRVVYEALVGPIPEGRDLDHLCRNTSCVNPRHLEPVTNRENVLRGIGPTAVNARKTHCKHGHSFTTANTIIRSNGRECRTCKTMRRSA